MKSVTVRQAKYFMDRINRNDLPYLKIKEHEVFDKVLSIIQSNSFYFEIGKQIEDEARRIVKDIEPKAKEIMDKINEISKKVPSTKAVKSKEKLQNEMKDLGAEYDKLYSSAQEELEKYKIKVIVEDNRGVKIFDLNDGDYDVINGIINWNINETPKESTADKYESEVKEEDLK